jgi:sortase A
MLEGTSTAVLNKGLWHLPGTSDPSLGGNTVISGHRYKWQPPDPRTLWNIDKVKVGDTITVRWNDRSYTYKVVKTAIVPPTQVSILDNTTQPQLTIFSCTPLFTSKNRLVLTALPV